MKWYEEEADKYDKVWDRGYAGTPSNSLDVFNLDRNLKVLDIGCGCGEFSHRFTDYTGIDISKSAIELAKRRRKDATFHIGGFHSLNLFKDDKFELVISVDVLEHLPPEVVEECLLNTSKLSSKLFSF